MRRPPHAHPLPQAMTNAPRRWSVRPNGGVLQPGQSVTVTLSLIKHDAKESVAFDHHLILSLPLTAEDAARLSEIRAANGRASIEALAQENPQARRPSGPSAAAGSCAHQCLTARR